MLSVVLLQTRQTFTWLKGANCSGGANTLLIDMQADVQPRWVRMLLKGRLLQLKLPCEVCPNMSQAQRSKASGRLVLSMPRANPEASLDITAMRPKQTGVVHSLYNQLSFNPLIHLE